MFISFLLDIDECAEDNGGCDQLCLNFDGSYMCDCDFGYLMEANDTCVDEDECADDNGGCQQVSCVDVYSSPQFDI